MTKRLWNWRIWTGFVVSLAATFSYLPLFIRWPVTRDFPWVNLLLFVVSLYLLGTGLVRAYRRPAEYRGRVGGSLLALVSVVLLGLFAAGTFFAARMLPTPENALRVGQTAPDFTLTDVENGPVSLAQLRQSKRAVLLIFYRGYW